jgi:hypothetical protein
MDDGKSKISAHRGGTNDWIIHNSILLITMYTAIMAKILKKQKPQLITLLLVFCIIGLPLKMPAPPDGIYQPMMNGLNY